MPYLVQFRRYALAFRAPVRTAHGRWTQRDGVIVRLEDEAGGIGYGEAAPVPEFGAETIEDVTAACRELGDRADDAHLDAVPASLGSLRQALTAARRREKVEPRHRHLGPERVLVLEGAYREDPSGRIYQPGDWHEMPPGSAHAYSVLPGRDLLLAVSVTQGIDVEGYGALDSTPR